MVLSNEAMNLYEQYKINAMVYWQNAKLYNWENIKYFLLKTANIWSNYESYKNNVYNSLLNINVDNLKIDDILTYSMIAKTIYDLSKNDVQKQELHNFIEKLQNKLNFIESKQKENFRDCRKDYIFALNIAVNVYVDPIYEKYNFNQHWEDVNFRNIYQTDLKECIYLEKNIRAISRLATNIINNLEQNEEMNY